MGRKFGPLLMAVAALGLWAATQMPWVTATVNDDKSGQSIIALRGSQWSVEATAVALLVLAGMVAGLALRRGARRGVGVLVALAGAVVTWRPFALLCGGNEAAVAARAEELLRSVDTSSTVVGATSISDWAKVTAVLIQPDGPVVAIVAGSLALVGGIWLAMRPGQDTLAARKYVSKGERTAKLDADLRAAPDSGRVIWDALDEDIDPTDFSHPQG